jgi:O-antigen/teichoic acid export membrane protein
MRSEAPGLAGSKVEPDILDTTDAGPAAIRGGALRVAGYAAGVLVTVGSAAVLFRYLGVEAAGRYVTVLTLVVIASGIVDLGLTMIAVRELAVRPRAEARHLMRNVVGLRLALTCMGIAAAVGFAALAGYPTEMVLGTLVAGVGMLAAAAQGTLAADLMVRMRLGWLTAIELLRQTLVAVGIVVLVAAGAALLPFFATLIPAGVVALGLTVVLVRQDVPIRPAFDLREWRAILGQMLPYAAATALTTVYLRVAVILVSLQGTARETGYYGAAFRVTEVLLLVPNLIVSTAFPIFARAARDDRERFAYAVQRMYEAGLLLGAWLAAVLVVGAPFVIDVVAGGDFEPSVAVLRIQAAALLATFVGSSFLYALLTLKRHAVLLALTGGAFVVNVALVSVLLPIGGIEMAALATVIAEIGLLIGAGAAVRQAVPALRIASAPAIRTLPALGGTVALALIPGAPAVALAALAALLFPLLALLSGAVPEEIAVEARRLLHARGGRGRR